MNKNFSKHQQKIIKNYYDNRDAISLQRLSELVTELYLAEGKARERQWKYLDGVLAKAWAAQGSDRAFAEKGRSETARAISSKN